MADLSIQGEVVVNSEKAESAFDRVGDKASQMANEVVTSAGKAGQAVDKIGDGADKGAEKFTRAEARMRDSIKRSTRELEMLGKTASQKFEANLEFKGLDKAKFQPFLNELRQAEEATKRAETGISSMSATAQMAGRAMALAFSGAAITGFLGKVVSVQREFDVLNSSLKTVTGSSAAAEREMAWLKDFAKETPFGLAQATQGFVKMKALGLDPTRAALTSFGNTASAMGKDLNQMIEAVADASTGEFERLKEFGIKAKKEGDNVSLTFQGVTTTIRNSAADITKYLEDIGNTSFGGAMEERAKTLDGTIAALGDTWDELFRTVSTNNVGGLIFDSVTLANGALEDATTILRALGGAAQDAGRDTGALSTIQSGIATVFETVAVLGANLKFVLVGIGNEIGGLAAQVAQAAQFNFSGVAAIRRAMVADAEAARKEIDATTARILNARKAQEEYARYATRNASAATDPRRVDLGGSAPRATGGVSSGTAKAVKETISEYDKLIKKLSDELPKAAAEAEAAQMGYNKSQTEFLALAGSPAWASFSNSQRAVVASMFEGKIASEQAGEAAKALSKAYAEAAAERIKTIQSMERAADSLQSQNDALREEIELIGLSTEQQTLVLQQRNDVIILTKEATLAELERQSAITGTQTRVEIALASEIEALKERNALLGAKAGKNAAQDLEKANTDAAKKAQDEWQRTSDSINQSLTDALLRGFESGKDFAKNLRDTVVNMFKTMVLRPIISAVVNPVAGAITGALGLSGTAQAASGGSSLLGNVGSIASGANSLGLLGSIGATVSGAVGSAIGAVSGGLVAANAATATLITGSAASAAAAAAGAATAGGAAASAAASAASAGSSIASTLGVLGPLALGVGALLLIAKATKGETRTGGQFGVAFDGSVTNQRRDQTYTIEGQQFDRDFTNGLQTALKDGIAYRLEGDPVAQESAIRDAVSGTASGINGFLKALGSAATLTGFSAGLETSGKGRGGVFAGGMLSNGTTFGESGKGDNYAGTLYEKFSTSSPDFKTALENFTLDLKQSTIQALQTVSDIPQAVQKMLQGVDAEALTEDAANKLLETINAQIVGVETLRASFENIGLDKLAELSFDAASGLAAAAGGFDALQGKLATYYDAFYSEEEKRANTIRQITKTLRDAGAQVTADDVGKATREQFRTIYESIVDVGGAADPVAVALLNVAGAFASVTPAAEDAAKAAKEMADAQVRSAEQAAQEAARRAEEVARERAGLESQLLQLLGNTTALRERELEALDASNRALQEHIYAVEDARAAYQKSVEGAQGAYALLERSVAAERKAADDAFSAQKAALQKESSAKLDALQSQVQSARDAADRIRGIASSLAGALKSVRIESPQLDFARLTGARATVSGAAASGNILAAGLESALGVLGEDNRRFYGRFEDYAFAQGVTAGEVAKLNDSAKAQLSAAEAISMGLQAQIDVEKMLAETQLAAMQAGYDAQVSRLDDALELGKSQLDALLGIDTSVVSVQEALGRLTGAVNASNAALQAQKAAEAAAAMSMAGGAYLTSEQADAQRRSYSDAELQALGFDPADIKAYASFARGEGAALARGGLTDVVDEIIRRGQVAIDRATGYSYGTNTDAAGNRYSDTKAYYDSLKDAQRVAAAEAWTNSDTGNGISAGELRQILAVGAVAGQQLYSSSKNLDLEKLPGVDGSHAGGLAYVPFDGYRAELHKGERVLTSDEARAYTPSAYPMSMVQNGASNADLAAALRAMAERLDAIEANTRATAGHTAGTDRKLARVVKNDAIATEVQPA